MKGKMYRLTGTGLFGKHSQGKYGATEIPRSKSAGKRPAQGRKPPDRPASSIPGKRNEE